jgi:hypothetical protein
MKAFTLWYAGMVVSDATYATSAAKAVKTFSAGKRGTVVATPHDATREEMDKAREASKVVPA